MEASTLTHASARTGILGRKSPLLKLQGDERLVALIRSGNEHAFEVLFDRYHSRLLAFCRHMLRSTEDAEDVLQEVFVKAHAAMIADERPINVRPWLYRIARNRCLNHLRRPVPDGQDTMDVLVGEGGVTTAERVQSREDFRALVADVQDLPETQRTALLLREMDALSYEEIAVTMDTTIPAVKSLLVRARMSLAEATQSRQLTCGEVRLELAEAAEGLRKASGPVRHHVKQCEQCRDFRGQLRSNTKALAALAPLGPLSLLFKSLIAKFGFGGSGTAASGSAAGSGGIAGGTAVAGAGGGTAAVSGGAAVAGAGGSGAVAGASLSGAAVGGAGAAGGAGLGSAAVGGLTGAIGAKAAATAATAALLTAGAVEVKQIYSTSPDAGTRTVLSDAKSPTTHHAADQHVAAPVRVDVPAATVTVAAAAADSANQDPATDQAPAPPATPPADNPPASTVADNPPATTQPATDASGDALATDDVPPAESYTPATAVVGPAAGGSGAQNEDEDGQLVVQPSGSGPSQTTTPPGGAAAPQQPPATPPPATTPPVLTPGASTPVAPGGSSGTSTPPATPPASEPTPAAN
jgi:RNA polymerase sigma factor (sigma-70 family)